MTANSKKDIEERLREEGSELSKRAARYIRLKRREIEELRAMLYQSPPPPPAP